MTSFCLYPNFALNLCEALVLQYAARKNIFPRFWNIIGSSKRPCNYQLSINVLAEKRPYFPSPKSSNQELSSNQEIYFRQLFGLRKDHIYHFWNGQNKNFSVISKYHISVNFLAQEKIVFLISEKVKTRTFQ